MVALESDHERIKDELEPPDWPDGAGDVIQQDQAAAATRTRAISRTARWSSGMLHTLNVATTVSKLASL